MTRVNYALLLLVLGPFCLSPVAAADLFDGANLDNGRRLEVENECNGSCHLRYVEGKDPTALFNRNPRKVHNAAELYDQVQRCTIKLNSSVFPEDVKDIAAALNNDYYHFK